MAKSTLVLYASVLAGLTSLALGIPTATGASSASRSSGPEPTGPIIQVQFPDIREMYEEPNIRGSLVDIKSSRTTLAICPEKDLIEGRVSSCMPLTVTLAPGKAEMLTSSSTNMISCTFTGTTTGACSFSASKLEGTESTSFSGTMKYSTSLDFFPVTITAGQEKLAGNGGATATDGGATPTGTGSAGTETGTGTGTGGNAPASTSSTGGMPKITGVPGWAIAGAGAVMGAALIL
ncbi:hypothetical protein FQN57_005041 [Myotisia sp. PD_48]|nr:hypothetical protein FQN57_005041 [Myotisia sp. PD_48]